MIPVFTIITTVPSMNYRPQQWEDLLGLEEAYQSLVSLECAWEWLIVGETLVSHHWATDGRVKAIRNQQGGATAFNIGLAHARGEFVMELDGASKILSGTNQILDQLLKKPQVAYGFGQTIEWEYEQGVAVRVPMTCPYGVVPIGDVLRYWDRHSAWWFVPGSVVWRKKHLIAAGGYGALPDIQEVVPIMIAPAAAPALAVEAEGYQITRFKDDPDRSGVISRDGQHSRRLLHDQLMYGRELGYRPH